MATVRFSDKLKEDITQNAKKMFKQEHDQAVKATPTQWTGDYLYNTIFTEDIRDKMNALPDKFLDTTSKLSFGGFRNVPQGEFNAPDVEFTLNACHKGQPLMIGIRVGVVCRSILILHALQPYRQSIKYGQQVLRQ